MFTHRPMGEWYFHLPSVWCVSWTTNRVTNRVRIRNKLQRMGIAWTERGNKVVHDDVFVFIPLLSSSLVFSSSMVHGGMSMCQNNKSARSVRKQQKMSSSFPPISLSLCLSLFVFWIRSFSSGNIPTQQNQRCLSLCLSLIVLWTLSCRRKKTEGFPFPGIMSEETRVSLAHGLVLSIPPNSAHDYLTVDSRQRPKVLEGNEMSRRP